MLRGKTFVAFVIAVLVLAAPASGSMRHRGVEQRGNEPFNSFRRLDLELTLLNQQLATLQKTVTAPQANPRLWATPAQRMQRTVTSMTKITDRLRIRYHRAGYPFGARAFSRIGRRLASLQSALGRLLSARTQRSAERAANTLSELVVQTMLDYQHVSGGYGAVHCRPHKWACCQPKPDVAGRRHADACAWQCVPQASSCKGFPGPRTPAP